MSQSASNINDTFFHGMYKDVWKQLIPPGLSEAECSFIEDVAGLQQGNSILDLMCGYGRHAIELAKRGFALTAVDNQEDYIKEINTAAAQLALPINTKQATANDVLLSGEYNAVICMGNSFAFFNKNDAATLLQKIASHLVSGGKFIINSWMIAEIAIRHFKAYDWFKIEGYKYLLNYTYHFSPSRIESEHTLISSDGKVEVLHGVDYIFTLAELEVLLNDAGLFTKALYSTPNKRKFKMGDNKIYIVAEKA